MTVSDNARLQPHLPMKPVTARALLAILALIMLNGCAVFSPSRTMLYDTPDGQVLLEQVVSRGSTAVFRDKQELGASHPIMLDASILARVLEGLSFQNSTRAIATGTTATNADPNTVPLFTEQEIAFLAPRLSEALSRATPSQFVAFRLPRASHATPRTGPRTNAAEEQTAGALYAYGRSIHLTITAWPRSEALGTADKAAFAFSPTSALRPDAYRRSALPFPDTMPSFVVDYRKLPTTPIRTVTAESVTPQTPPQPSPAPTALATPQAPSQSDGQLQRELQALKDLIIQKDLELERLRQELQQTKQEPRITAPPPAPAPRAKKPSATVPPSQRP